MEHSMHERIRERAYQLWDAGGRVEGQADQHWLCAEREILSQSLTPAASPSLGAARMHRGGAAARHQRTANPADGARGEIRRRRARARARDAGW